MQIYQIWYKSEVITDHEKSLNVSDFSSCKRKLVECPLPVKLNFLPTKKLRFELVNQIGNKILFRTCFTIERLSSFAEFFSTRPLIQRAKELEKSCYIWLGQLVELSSLIGIIKLLLNFTSILIFPPEESSDWVFLIWIEERKLYVFDRNQRNYIKRCLNFWNDSFFKQEIKSYGNLKFCEYALFIQSKLTESSQTPSSLVFC